jgi:hypothetical protein
MILRPGCKDVAAAALAIITSVMTLANYSLSLSVRAWLRDARSSARLIMIDLICSQFRFLRASSSVYCAPTTRRRILWRQQLNFTAAMAEWARERERTSSPPRKRITRVTGGHRTNFLVFTDYAPLEGVHSGVILIFWFAPLKHPKKPHVPKRTSKKHFLAIPGQFVKCPMDDRKGSYIGRQEFRYFLKSWISFMSSCAFFLNHLNMFKR